MKFSIIIPTMWQAYDQLIGMIQKYSDHPLVGEILIIQNAPGMSLGDTYGKVRVLNNGKNLFVNPSWNLGVKEAKHELVILANDDITIPEIDKLLSMIQFWLREGMIFGAATKCFAQKRREELPLLTINGMKGAEDTMKYGFGVFMALHKKDYVEIPEDLKIWFGDRVLFNALDPYVFETDIKTEMGVTTKAMGNTRVFWVAEHKYYFREIEDVKKS